MYSRSTSVFPSGEKRVRTHWYEELAPATSIVFTVVPLTVSAIVKRGRKLVFRPFG